LPFESIFKIELKLSAEYKICKMNFEKLVFRIQQTNEILQQNAVKAVNIHLTLRNWLVGFYIVEFEQKG